MLPNNIGSNFTGFGSLIHLYYEIIEDDSNFIELSFENTTWFEANLAAVLGAIIELLNRRGKSVELSQIPPRIEDVLRRNGFLISIKERFL